MLGAPSPLAQRIKKLQAHLEKENPVLLDVVNGFRQLDRVAYSLGVLDRDESFATRVPWWPMVSVLGTFSSGKSTFINSYLGQKVQTAGNQAVDDKFTVICFGGEDSARVLPGRALDADPRFPFYQMSDAIDEVAPGEGARIDTYLQLKTCRSEHLRGKILIDSPGFDADAQRNSTLRITDHIIDLSDLVLVFFDARHPEPGAMQDTLEHLVGRTINRPDANKFLFVLNQIDNAAREDNPEDVFAAWQRALAAKGLTAGRFFSIYDRQSAIHIEDPALRERFESKSAHDLAEIEARIQQVEVERAYRIIGVLEQTAKNLRDRVVPAVRAARARWRRRVLWTDALLGGMSFALFLGWSIGAGHWDGLSFTHPWYLAIVSGTWSLVAAVTALGTLIVWAHYTVRRLAERSVARGLTRAPDIEPVRDWVLRAFAHSVRPWHWSLGGGPAGWGPLSRRKVERVLEEADGYVQALNNRFADPSGKGARTGVETAAALPAQSAAPADHAPGDGPQGARDGRPPAAVGG